MSGEPGNCETENPPSARVNSDNFIYYLIGVRDTSEGFLRGDTDNFSPQIDVGEVVSGTIKQMYGSEKKGILAGETFEKRETSLATMVNQTFPGLGDKFRERTPEAVSLEQARVVFFDVKSGKLGVTEPKYGYGAEVSIFDLFQEAAQQNGLPLVGIHTHPRDAFFHLMIMYPFSQVNPAENFVYLEH